MCARLIALALLASVGCSSKIQPFLGQWVVSGRGTLNGTNFDSGGAPVPRYSITFKAGADSDLVSLDSAGCLLRWNVSGSTAALVSGQQCAAGGEELVPDPGTTIQLTVVDGSHLSGIGSASGTVVVEPGDSYFANASATGTLTRIGN